MSSRRPLPWPPWAGLAGGRPHRSPSRRRFFTSELPPHPSKKWRHGGRSRPRHGRHAPHLCRERGALRVCTIPQSRYCPPLPRRGLTKGRCTLAAIQGHEGCVQALIDGGANINMAQYDGLTARDIVKSSHEPKYAMQHRGPTQTPRRTTARGCIDCAWLTRRFCFFSSLLLPAALPFLTSSTSSTALPKASRACAARPASTSITRGWGPRTRRPMSPAPRSLCVYRGVGSDSGRAREGRWRDFRQGFPRGFPRGFRQGFRQGLRQGLRQSCQRACRARLHSVLTLCQPCVTLAVRHPHRAVRITLRVR